VLSRGGGGEMVREGFELGTGVDEEKNGFEGWE